MSTTKYTDARDINHRERSKLSSTLADFVPTDVGPFFGYAHENIVSTDILESFWSHVTARCPSMLAMLQKFKHRYSSGNEFLAILGESMSDSETASAFLLHIRNEDLAHVAALEAYNAGAWIVPPSDPTENKLNTSTFTDEIDEM